MKFEQRVSSLSGLATRRDFLRRCISLALPTVLLGNLVGPRTASAATPVPPRRERGAAQINVRDKGARGDGQHDDTSAFQAAIDALPDTGGTVQVPAGAYLIDAVVSVRLRSRTRLELSPDAKLVAKPNDAAKAYILYLYKVNDVEISGGQIIGDRAGHLGTTGEWGHGIQIRGSSHVTVRDIRISDCWGDGITIGGSDVRQATPSDDIVIVNVVSTGNRRQGLSIGRSTNVRVQDSEFSNTSGTNPQCGIDIEPDKPGGTSGVHIENCVVRDNQGPGIQIYKRVTDVTIERCTIERNRDAGILAVSAQDGLIVDNRIGDNGQVGVALRQQTSNFQIRGNRFYNNAIRRHRPANARSDEDIRSMSAVWAANDTLGINVTANVYEDK